MAPAVPTGMNAGVRMTPCGVRISPSRARPSVWWRVKAKVWVILPAILRAKQQACIAIGIEAIIEGDRVRVGLPHDIEAAKGTDQHKQRRLRQMKIGHQRVDNLEAVARRNE